MFSGFCFQVFNFVSTSCSASETNYFDFVVAFFYLVSGFNVSICGLKAIIEKFFDIFFCWVFSILDLFQAKFLIMLIVFISYTSKVKAYWIISYCLHCIMVCTIFQSRYCSYFLFILDRFYKFFAYPSRFWINYCWYKIFVFIFFPKYIFVMLLFSVFIRQLNSFLLFLTYKISFTLWEKSELLTKFFDYLDFCIGVHPFYQHF